MGKTTKLKIALFLFLLIFLDSVLFFPILTLIGNYLITPDQIQKSDLIAVISGPKYRSIYAICLYKTGLAKKLFFTGGTDPDSVMSDSERSRAFALELGVPSKDIYTDSTQIETSYEEAERLLLFISDHKKFRSVIVITDAYNTRRAKWTYEKVLGNQIQVRIVAVPFVMAGYTQEWWKSYEMLKMVPEEYVKLIFYLFRYQLTTGRIQSWLSYFDKY